MANMSLSEQVQVIYQVNLANSVTEHMPYRTELTNVAFSGSGSEYVSYKVGLSNSSLDDAAEKYTAYKVGMYIHMIYTPILIIFGLVGNMLSLLIMTRASNKHIPCCFLMACLAVSDTLVLLCALDYYLIVDLFIMMSQLHCDFLNFAFNWFATLSILLIVCVTANRYLAICKPFEFREWMDKTCTKKAFAAIVIFTLFFNIPHIFTGELLNPKTCSAFGMPGVFTQVYAWMTLCLFSMIPFIMVTIMSILILRKIRRRTKWLSRYTIKRFSDGSVGSRELLTSPSSPVLNSGTFSEINNPAANSIFYFDLQQYADITNDNNLSTPITTSLGMAIYNPTYDTSIHKTSESDADFTLNTDEIPYIDATESAMSSSSFAIDNTITDQGGCTLSNKRGSYTDYSKTHHCNNKECDTVRTRATPYTNSVCLDAIELEERVINSPPHTVSGADQVIMASIDTFHTSGKNKVKSLDRQLAIMLTAVSLAFLVLSLPQTIRYVVYTIVDNQSSAAAYANYILAYHMTNKLYATNNSINFYIYCLTGEKFRNDLRELFCWKTKSVSLSH